MAVLIAGCAGLVGSHLSHHLLQKGEKILGVDNLCTGSLANVDFLKTHAQFTFLEQDITQPFEVSEPITQIYHMASPASPDDFENKAMEILWVNSLGTQHLLNIAKTHQAKMLFASTSEVYGDPLVHPQKEDYWGHVNPNGPRSCYDESKRFGESLMFNFCQRHNVDFTIARIFNTYGPRMRLQDGRVVSNFILQSLKGEPMILHDGGQQTRSFCYVQDLVEGLEGLMSTPRTRGEVYNLGNPNEFTIETLATTICEIAGQKITLKSVPSPRQDDPKKRRPDITKVQAAIGWEPQVSLREGLTLTFEDFKERQQHT